MADAMTREPTLPRNFLGLPPKLSDPQTSRILVLPVPYDSTTSYRAGAREGPTAIIDASRQLEEFDEEIKQEPCLGGIHTLPELEPHLGNPAQMIERVARAVTEVAQEGRLMVTLGGDHSVSVGAVKAMRSLYPDLSVLFLDAHADLRQEYLGTPYSHASTARRIGELCPVVLAGVRSMSEEEWTFIGNREIPVYLWNADSTGSAVAQELLGHLTPHIYISVDLDVLDPSLMPAVGTPEPGGMGWHDLLALLRELATHRQVVGFDLMELAPSLGPPACSFTAARLAYKLMGYATLTHNRPVFASALQQHEKAEGP